MNYAALANTFQGDVALNHSLILGFDGCSIEVRSNSPALLATVDQYFVGYLQQPGPPAIVLDLLENPVTEPPLHLSHWPRPAEKGPKETFADVDDARLIGKFRTGLMFLQGVDRGLAIGPLQQNINQVINFINNQTISYWKRAGWEICHAAALTGTAGMVAFAGFSGGGKSTLMLHLMNEGPYTFVSNDRLLVKRIIDQDAYSSEARGIAKMPRVNPGTLLNNPALKEVLPPERRQALEGLASDELWNLEEKYDVPVRDIFGAERIAQHGFLAGVVILDWHRKADDATTLQRCSLSEQPRLLDALMKSPGPFYADALGRFATGHEQLEPHSYLHNLSKTPIYRLSGSTNFATAVQLCRPLLDSPAIDN